MGTTVFATQVRECAIHGLREPAQAREGDLRGFGAEGATLGTFRAGLKFVKATFTDSKFLKVAFTNLSGENCRWRPVVWKSGAAQAGLGRWNRAVRRKGSPK